MGQYRFLSNFWLAPIVYKNEEYPSSEHLFQALKTLSATEREWIRTSATPGQAKRRGKEITRRPDWEEVKDDIMRNVLRLKFAQNPALGQLLTDTGDQELVEGNTWGDVEWGVCNGVGKNKLGLMLQEIRKDLVAVSRSQSL
ncbi:MAG: NADAR family protein [Promethearchaeota archaeon]